MDKNANSSNYLLRQKIYLIGDFEFQIVGNKLPSLLDCLKVLFFHVRINNVTLKQSASLVIDEVILFWEKARIPIRKKNKCVEKLLNCYDDWRNLQKNKGQAFNEKKEVEFCALLTKLFDISHANAMQNIDEGQKDFLMNQRDKRTSCIGVVGKSFAREEEKKIEEKKVMNERLRKSNEEVKKLSEYPLNCLNVKMTFINFLTILR